MLTVEGGRIETTGGWVYWNFYSDDGSYVEIYGLNIIPERRNKGYARALLKGAISVIRAQYLDMEIRIVPRPLEEGIDPERLSIFYSSLGLKTWDGKIEVKSVPEKCKGCAYWGKSCKRNVTLKESK